MRAIEQAIADGVILRCLSKPFGVEEVNTALDEPVEHLRTHGRV